MVAFVRCQELSQAEDLFKEMLSKSDLQVNAVAYTTLLKGYCEAGMMSTACRILFRDMKSLPLSARTFNTFLRGCQRTGAVRSAWKAYNRLLATDPSALLDSSGLEYLVGILARAGCLTQSEQVLSTMKLFDTAEEMSVSAGGVQAMENAAVYLSMGQGFLCRGDIAQVRLSWIYV